MSATQIWCASDIKAKIAVLSKTPTWHAIEAINNDNKDEFYAILKENPDVGHTNLAEFPYTPIAHAVFYYALGENNHFLFYAKHLLKANASIPKKTLDDIIDCITPTLFIDGFSPKTIENRFQAFTTLFSLLTNVAVSTHESSTEQSAQSKSAQDELRCTLKKKEDDPLNYFGKKSITELDHKNLRRLHQILELEMPAGFIERPEHEE